MLRLQWFPTRLTRSLLAVGVLLTALGLSVGLDTAQALLTKGQVTDWEGPPEARPSPAERAVDLYLDRIAQRPSDAGAHRELGSAYLQRARETGDPTYYTRAERVLSTAFELDPSDPGTLISLGALALARHQFADALAWGERARALSPHRPGVYGVIGDAQVELGRYEEALDTIQRMVDLRPDRASYARVSYLRELHGDLPGAAQAMRMAADAGAMTDEQGVWTRVQLGHLLLKLGAIEDAEREYRWALANSPAPMNALALAALGRARLTEGDVRGAIPFYQQAVERLPLPEFVLTLGDLYEAVDRSAEASHQFELARALQALTLANGGNVDLDLAIFEAERGDPLRALASARAEVGRRESIHAHDALAWALYHTGDYASAREASNRALRLGTEESSMLFHSALIDLGLGEPQAARDQLARALRLDPGFSARYAPVARRLLAELEDR